MVAAFLLLNFKSLASNFPNPTLRSLRESVVAKAVGGVYLSSLVVLGSNIVLNSNRDDAEEKKLRSRIFSAIESNDKVLEIGIGTNGQSANSRYYPSEIELTGIDPFLDERLVAGTKNGSRKFTLVQGTVEALPFDNEMFDVVVSSLVFCTIKKPSVALQEIARVLKTNGIVINAYVCNETKKNDTMYTLIQKLTCGTRTG